MQSHYEWGAPFLVTGAVAITNGWISDFAPELENVASGGQLVAFRAFGDVILGVAKPGHIGDGGPGGAFWMPLKIEMCGPKNMLKSILSQRLKI